MTDIQEKLINISPGKYLFTQGSPADMAYNLMQGRISLWRDGIKVSALDSNNIIGFEGLYSKAGTYPYSAYAETYSRLYIFPREKLPEMFLTHPTLGEQVYRDLAGRLNNLWQFVSPLGQKNDAPYFLGEIKSFYPGEYVIREGEDTKEIYRIISTDLGLEVSKQGETINTLTQPGDFFGEMAAVLQEARNASVRTIGESVLEIYPGELIYNILYDYPQLSHCLIKNLSRRLADMNRYILERP